eukprot:187107-Amorphochlora_amoeboformis.AAC.1
MKLLVSIVAIFNHRIQPVQQTRQKQLSIWAEFVKDYQKAQKSTSIDVAKAAASSGPPFGNAKINRKRPSALLTCE